MLVQSARTAEEHGRRPTERLSFRGLEKNATTIRLAKMNLAVHGLDGNIQKAITYYDEPHELVGKADYMMANPRFNAPPALRPARCQQAGQGLKRQLHLDPLLYTANRDRLG